MQDKDKLQQFEFDHWSSVAREDPARFESMREALLEDMIQQTPEKLRPRIEGLQWRIDQIRNLSSNPMSSCLRISKMMWESVIGDHGLITALETPEKILRPPREDSENKVVQLKKREDPDSSS